MTVKKLCGLVKEADRHGLLMEFIQALLRGSFLAGYKFGLGNEKVPARSDIIDIEIVRSVDDTVDIAWEECGMLDIWKASGRVK